MRTLVETYGVVLRTLKYGESSIIFDAYTMSHGLKSFIISGVRTQKSKQGASMYKVMNILDICFYDKEHEQLIRPKTCTYHNKYARLQVDVIRTAVAAFIMEITRNSIKEKEQNEGLLHYIIRGLENLDNSDQLNLVDFYLRYLIGLTKHLGFMPLNNYDEQHNVFDLLNGRYTMVAHDNVYTMTKENSAILHKMLSDENPIKLSNELRDSLTDDMVKYFMLHMEGFPVLKTLGVLRSLG
jgi:DNA repair protein RecO (recombination protein O)